MGFVVSGILELHNLTKSVNSGLSSPSVILAEAFSKFSAFQREFHSPNRTNLGMRSRPYKADFGGEINFSIM
jgi:hypothetical protein